MRSIHIGVPTGLSREAPATTGDLGVVTQFAAAPGTSVPWSVGNGTGWGGEEWNCGMWV